MPQIIIVLGMHRSGTSALAGMLAKTGARCGEPLLPANAGNPRGYWELAPLVELNDRVLEILKRRWLDASPLPGGWSARDDVRALEFVAAGLLRDQFSAHQLGMLKDPRLCLTMPFWRRVLQRLEWPIALLVIARPLGEVICSIQARDPIGARDIAYLWARSMLEALRACFHDRHLLLTYDQLLESPLYVLKQIARDFDVTLEAESFENFVDAGLRHHAGLSPDDIPEALVQLCDDLYAMIDEASRHGAPIGAARFRAAEAAMDLLDHSMLPEMQQEALCSARAERALALADVDSARTNIHRLADEIATARRTIDALGQEIEAARRAHHDRDEIDRQLRARVEVLERGLEVKSGSNAS